MVNLENELKQKMISTSKELADKEEEISKLKKAHNKEKKSLFSQHIKKNKKEFCQTRTQSYIKFYPKHFFSFFFYVNKNDPAPSFIA